MEAVELRKKEFAVAVVLGACVRLWVCARAVTSAAVRAGQRRRLRGRRRGLCCCRLISAVVLLQEVPVQALERSRGGGFPGGRILEVVARQPYLLSFNRDRCSRASLVESHRKLEQIYTNAN